jgi:nucleoside-diphosphate-sugar epimerase
VLAALTSRPEVTLVAACRNPERLPAGFVGETRAGDLRDPAYRRDVVADVDVVCHTGTWSAFWGHADQERRIFYEPNLDLIEQSVRAGVRRFIQTSTVVMAAPRAEPAGPGPAGLSGPQRRPCRWAGAGGAA